MAKRFLLLHGGGLGAWVWDKVIPHLDLPAIAPDLPGRGQRPVAHLHQLNLNHISDYIAQIAHQASQPGDSFILVAHSFSGVLAPGLAARLMLSKVVYLAACVPQAGDNALSTMRLPDRLMTRLALFLTEHGVSLPRNLVESTVRRSACNDLDEATTQELLNRFVMREPIAMFLEGVEAPPNLPRAYIKLSHDQGSLPPARQDVMVARLGNIQLLTLDSGHSAMLSQPKALAQLLNDLALST